jgi:hypothetical protein
MYRADPLYRERTILPTVPPPYSPAIPETYPPPSTYAHAEFVIKANPRSRSDSSHQQQEAPLYSQQWIND